MAFFSSDITKSCTYTRLRDVGRDHFQVIHVVHTVPLELAVHPKATTYRVAPHSVTHVTQFKTNKPGNLREIFLISKSENVVFVTCHMSLVFFRENYFPNSLGFI